MPITFPFLFLGVIEKEHDQRDALELDGPSLFPLPLNICALVHSVADPLRTREHRDKERDGASVFVDHAHATDEQGSKHGHPLLAEIGRAHV